MAALADNKDRDLKPSGDLLAFPVVAADIIYRGALVKINAAGYLAPQAAEAGAHNCGVAYEKKDNSSGIAGALKCRVQVEGVVELDGAGFTQAHLGEAAYASDDDTVSPTQAANELEVGKVVEYISATKVLVKLNGLK